MPRIDRNEVFENGKLIYYEEVEVPDPEPTDKERIAELEAQLAKLHGALDDVSKAESFADAKTKIADRIAEVIAPALPEEPIDEPIKAGR